MVRSFRHGKKAGSADWSKSHPLPTFKFPRFYPTTKSIQPKTVRLLDKHPFHNKLTNKLLIDSTYVIGLLITKIPLAPSINLNDLVIIDLYTEQSDKARSHSQSTVLD